MNVKTLGSFLFVVVFLGCSSNSTQSGGWSQSMRGMAEAYEKLIPYIYDSKRFRDPNNEKYINLQLKTLNQNASSLNSHIAKGISGDDPLFRVGLKGLKNQIQKASESYFVQSYDYSQNLLQSSVNYCNSCHSRTHMGPTFIKWDHFSDITSKLRPLDYGDILVATRQFPKAVTVLQEGFFEKDISEAQREKILKRIMTVTLKNLNSPSKALEILNEVPSSKMGGKLKTDLPQWKAYLVQWNKGQLNLTLEEVLKMFPTEGQNFVQSLHHSEILHMALSQKTEKELRAKTYRSLGVIYAHYPELGSWNLPETYFETCIYQYPGSKIAQQCYFDLEGRLKSQRSSVNAPFSREDNAQLKKLKAIANRKPGKTDRLSGEFGFEDL